MSEQPDFTESTEELYEEAPCGYVSHRQGDGLILRINRTLAEWLGHEPAALVGKRRFQDLLSAPARLLHETRHQVMLRMSGLAGGLALEMLRADGARMPVLVTSRLKRDAAGAPSWVRTNVFDATAHRRYEQELRTARDAAEQASNKARHAQAAADAANEAKSRFLSSMNHEFRTPINIISGFANLLTVPNLVTGEAKRQAYLAEMRTAAQHLVEMLEDATRYGRLDALEREPRLYPMRLREVAQSAIRMAGEDLDKLGVEASLLTGPDDPVAMVNDAAVEAVSCMLRDIAQRALARTELQVSVRAKGSVAIAIGGSALAQSERTLRSLLSPLDTSEVLQRGLEGSGLKLVFAQRVLHICGGLLSLDGAPEGSLSVCMSFATNREIDLRCVVPG